MDRPRPALTNNDRIILLWSIVGLCGIFGYFLIYISHRLAVGHFGDFPTFYHAARAMLAGRDPYVPVEDNLAYVYPPLFGWLCIPLAYLSKLNAARVMLLINIACVLAAIFIAAAELARRFNIPRMTVAGLFAICLMASGLGENELRGQLQQMECDTIMLLMFTLGLRFLDSRPWLAGSALAFALNIKYLSLVFLPYLLLRRRWKAAGGMMLGSVVFAFLPAITLGWTEDLRCLKVALGGLLGWVGIHSSGAQVANVHHMHSMVSISLTSSIARLLREQNHSSALAIPIAIAAIGCIILTAWWMYRRHGLPMWRWPSAVGQTSQPFAGLVALEWLGLVAAALLFSPNTNTRHLVLAILLEVAAAILLLIPRPGVSRMPLIIGTITLVVGFAMPIPHWFSLPFVHQYFRLSIVSWCLLLMYFTLLKVGLNAVSQAQKSIIIHE